MKEVHSDCVCIKKIKKNMQIHIGGVLILSGAHKEKAWSCAVKYNLQCTSIENIVVSFLFFFTQRLTSTLLFIL